MPRTRTGQRRINVAGIPSLAKPFVGIQPARGFNLEFLLQNYHIPDLVPPHSYLAFYFWLACFIQSGCFCACWKHGNSMVNGQRHGPYLSLVDRYCAWPLAEFLSVYRQ